MSNPFLAGNAKIHPKLMTVLASHAFAPTGGLIPKGPEIRIIVRHKPTAEMAKVMTRVVGVRNVNRVYTRVFAGQALSVTPQAVAELALRPDVDNIWFDEPVHTWLDASAPLIGATEANRAGMTGRGIRIGIVDTGIDPDHPDFGGRILDLHDLTGEGLPDKNGHGTHVAGITGGAGTASGGRYVGIAPECQFVIAKVLRGDGSGLTSDVIAGLEYVLEKRVQVVNLSLGSGGPCDGSDALSVACDSAANRGTIICVAAGNDGPAAGSVGSPGCARQVITVGATDKQDRVTGFSSRGPTGDGRDKPDICFPGGDIHSCRAAGTSMGTPIDEYYTTASGTSMATPHATGACALLLQASPGSTPQQIKEVLVHTAKSLQLDVNTQGSGRAQVQAALLAIQPSVGPPPSPTTPPGNSPPPPAGNGCLQAFRTVVSRRP